MLLRFSAWGLVVVLSSLSSSQAQPVPLREPGTVANSNPSAPPLPTRSVDFRKLLTMSASERETILSSRQARQRQILEEKLKEYDLLSPADQELRLRSLEMRLYLRPLMGMAESNRVSYLAAVPERVQRLVNERLQEWDQLPPDLQKDVLENERVITMFVRSGPALPSKNAELSALSAPERARAEESIRRWNALPEPRRERIQDHFRRFFDLPKDEKAKAMESLNPVERLQMKASLQAFEKLPQDQRERCISGFTKFASLSASERQQFLQDAERWKNLSPQDRKVWRALVSQVSPRPPFPGGSKSPPMPGPLRPNAPALTNK